MTRTQFTAGLRRGAGSLWPILAVVAALFPVLGVFSTSSVFYVRDVGIFFWPRHLWLKTNWRASEWPWWDPYAATGHAAVADALNQFFLLPVTLLRLLTPDVIGFNVWIAAPFPLMALGAWLWLRRHVSSAAACVGAAIYAVAGPVVSTGHFPNLSWAIALIPWVLWSVDSVIGRPGVKPIATLAGCIALQAVAGEPVTLAATGALAIAYAIAGASVTERRERWARTSRVAAGLVVGALLSAVQTLPLIIATRRAARSDSINSSVWSLHPLEVVETFIAHLFGHADDGLPDTMPWIIGLHDGREPLFTTLYVGLGALVLATIRPRDPATRQTRLFWWAVAGVALIAALGAYTPLYPALQAAVPILQSFRYPIKYVVFCVVAIAALAAFGADAFLAHARSRQSMRRPVLPLVATGGVVFASMVLGVLTITRPDWIDVFWEATASFADIEDSSRAAKWMIGRSAPLFLGVAALGSCMALLLTVVWRGHGGARLAAVVLCGVAIADPLIVNRDLHPTMPASAIRPPAWTSAAQAHLADRVYIGGRVMRLLGPQAQHLVRLDAPETFNGDAELPVQQGNVLLAAELVYYPAAWRLRESISFDLPQLWPREYTVMINRFRRVPREDRFRFLWRTGVRYYYVSEPPCAGATALTMPVMSTGPMALYECQQEPRRVYVTNMARVEPNLSHQIGLMFDADHDPYATVLLDREPPVAAGRSGVGLEAPDAQVVRERNTELVVEVAVGTEGGYLNVVDSYDPDWRVEVDGEPGTLLRANGLFRAVRLTPGRHVVEFRYIPVAFYGGAVVSLLTAAGFAAFWVLQVRHRRGAPLGRRNAC